MQVCSSSRRGAQLIDMDAEGRGTKGRKVKGRWETRCLLVRTDGTPKHPAGTPSGE